MKVKSEREVAQSCPTLRDPMDYTAHPAPASMGLSRQEYWSGVPLPSPTMCYLGINLIQVMYDLYSEFYKTLLREGKPK